MIKETISEKLILSVPINLFEHIAKVEKADLLKKYMESLVALFAKNENSELISICADGLLLSGILEEMIKSNKNMSQTIKHSITLMDNITSSYKMILEEYREKNIKLDDENIKKFFGISKSSESGVIIISKKISLEFELGLHLHGILALAKKIVKENKIKMLSKQNPTVNYFNLSVEKILSTIIVNSIIEDITIAESLEYFDYKYFLMNY